MLVCMCAQSIQSCLTPCNPVDYSPGSSVHGILQAKILEWVAMPSSWGIIRYYDMKNEWSELSFSRIFNYSMENKHHKSQRNPQTKNTLYHFFFFFNPFTCEACDCSHLGNNCDPKTGRCICPPNTIGEKCSKCAPRTWGHSITTGCKVSELLYFIS